MASPVELFRSRDYPVGDSDGSSFFVSAGGGKCGVGTRTTHLTPQKVCCWIDGGDFFSSRSSKHSSMSCSYKERYYY